MTPEELRIEMRQLREEGRDVRSIASEAERLLRSQRSGNEPWEEWAQALLDRAAELPQAKGYPWREPSDLAEIRRERPEGPRALPLRMSRTALLDRLHGAWLGRCAGCLLGKPYEGWRSPRLWGFLKETGDYPLSGYFRMPASPQIRKRYELDAENLRSLSIRRVKFGPEDDDTNYTVIALALMRQKGPKFAPADVAELWLKSLPLLHTYTAERAAYRNFANGIGPPESARVRNPYREWIGAQIRADFFGYVTAGRPELAAEFAWRDASISHVKNGIYGEMWVAAMLAAAAATDDIREVIRIGLSEIPARSRLAAAIHDAVHWRDERIPFEEAIARIHKRWDEQSPHDWCHTISNAQIVALGLLWGEGDFGKAICRAVQACFDTDCNGATVGSLMGMMLGARRLPRRWIAPLHGKLRTGVAGYPMARIADLAAQTLQVAAEIRRSR